MTRFKNRKYANKYAFLCAISCIFRPIGIGVQGLADAYIKMRFPYESDEAAQLNRDIFETIYFGAVEASMEIAAKDGPYSTFEGSPMSKVFFSDSC